MAPADAVVVEDSPTGVRAARAAGARVVGLVGTLSAQQLAQEGADVVILELTALA